MSESREVARLREEVGRLRKVIGYYADHDEGCTFTLHTPCSCGFSEALAAPAEEGSEHG